MGYEGFTAMEVKATGKFPLPCHLLKGPFATFNPHAVRVVKQQTVNTDTAAKMIQAKRLYFGNLSSEVSEERLISFICYSYDQLGVPRPPGVIVTSVHMRRDKNYAFVEFRSPDEATNAMGMDGITFEGQQLKVRRPKDFVGEGPEHVPHVSLAGTVSTTVADSPDKLFVGGIPPFLNEEQIQELLKAFGDLRSFHLVKDGNTGVSKVIIS